jgi:asparagine synthase (glutamine-hydrolysing)
MCGVAGFVGAFVPGLVERMNTAQRHRGPDGEGVFTDPDATIALGHVRLKILDLSDAAAQPMHSPSKRYVLIYNGEIYNYQELRRELEGRGAVFRSSGDTEILLAGLEIHGAAFVERLNGIFAFALWDRQERRLTLVRDPLGVKPLYYAEPRPGTLLFASEIKALCAHPELVREVDPAVVLEHLSYCHACGESTALKGVRRLLPGSLLTWHNGSFSIRRFWRPSFGDDESGGREAAVKWLHDEIKGATRRQLVSDVPVGVFLSGGLDSSLLAAAAAGEGRDLSAFTITYPRADNVVDGFVDDAPYARQVAQDLGTELVEIEIRPEVASLLPRLVHHLDEPLADPAAIACFLIARLARERGTPVLLSGQGADELFGGYPRYRAVMATAWADAVPKILRRGLARAAGILPGARSGSVGGTFRRVRRVLEGLDRGIDERFLTWCASTPESEVAAILHPDFRDALDGRRPKDSCLAHMNERGLVGLDRFLERDLSVYLANHNLLYTDKMGMAVGLEARVPLLDPRLAERVTRFPTSWKLGRGQTKVLLREAARGLVSRQIIERPKAGFGAPYRKWLRSDLGEMWQELTSEASVRSRGWFDAAALQDARRRSQEGRTDLYMLQWAVLTMEIWARGFLDRNPASLEPTPALRNLPHQAIDKR